jgi:uncharacterized protein
MGQGGLMSAMTSDSGDRELEAIHRAQQGHEPSMEEILASIRSIIADAPAKGTPRPASALVAQVAHSSDAVAPQSEPTEALQRPAPVGSAEIWRRNAVETEPADRDEAPLLSPEASEAAALSFGVLSADLAVRSAELADAMVRETLRPMLKQWLDDNLPAIVERLVRAEIQRVARGER